MTKVPQGFDFSFLSEEEARKILQVLERNEELQRAEKDRISKLQKTKRDIRWLQGVTGEWFEEIQRKKFCNETDVSQMLKQPLTYRLRKEMAKNDPMELQTSNSKTLTNQKKPTSVPSRPSFRSSLASLFSFRKPVKETVKLQPLGQKGCDGHVVPPGSSRGTPGQAKIHSSPLENQPVDSAFVPTPAIMRVGSGMPPPWDASVLENEFFQVLDDLDSTLAQEQSASSVSTSMSLNYGSRTPFGRSYSSGNRHGTITGTHKHRYNETSNMSIYDILRPGTPREGFKTFSPRTRTICDMYRTREPRILKKDYVQNTLGSTSLCFDSRQRLALPASRHFTARSLHFPTTTQNKSRFVPPSHQQTPKRTPLSSIIWNRSDSSGDRQNQEEFLRAPSPMEMDPADQYMYPRCFQENRRYELYHSQNVFQSASLNAPMDNAMSPDAFENSENMPFYYQDNPFARSFFSNTFRQSREQRFVQSSFWSQQKEYSPWSDLHPSRKPFTCSDRDFEMISIEANSAPAVHGHSIPSQHWEPFSSHYGTNLFRGQEEPHLWQPDFQTSPPESMEISPGNENQSAPHFGTPNVYPRTGSGYHIKSGGLECRQDSSPREVLINKEPYSFGIAQTLVSSFKNSFSQIPDEQGNSQSPNFQKSTMTLQKIIPNNPDILPIRNHMEDAVTDSNSIDSLSLAESQPNILVPEMNNEKNLTGSILEDKQLNKMDQTNTTGEIPQPVSQTVISNPLPDSQTYLSQDSAKSNRFNFNVPTKISSNRSPRVFSRKDTSQIYTSHREKANALKLEKSLPGNKKLSSTTSLSFTQESRTPPSFLSPNQDCHQELTVGNEDISSIIKNYHWHSEPTDPQNTQSPQEPVISDTEGEQCSLTRSTNCSKVASRNNSSSSSSDLSSGSPPDSSLSNNSFLDALVIPSSTMFFRKSPSDKDLFLGQREEKDNAGKNQNDQFAVSPSGNQKRTDSHMPIGDEVVDVVKCHSYSPFRNGKGKGRIRPRISCIEKLSRIENRSLPISEGSSLIEKNQSDSKISEISTIYCTLPRKSASFLINSRQPESKTMAASIRNGPLPFQMKNSVEDPIEKYPSSKFSPGSPEWMSECAKVVSDSVPVAPEDTERKTQMKVIRSASVRKGPLPFLIKRAISCPSGEPCLSTGKDERKEPSVSDTDTSAVTPRPWEKVVNSLENDLSVRDCFLTKRHHPKGFSPECTEKDGETIASRTGVFSLSNEDPLPFCADLSGKESGKTLHKFKTTSTFSVSGDEDNVRCLEVVSIYYTLPRKPSKKFCDLLQRYTQNSGPLTESPQVETETFPNDLERDESNYSPQDQSETPLSEDLKVPVNSAPSCFSQTTENMGVLKLPNRGLSEMVSVGADVSFHKGESRTRKMSPDNLAKTPLGDLQSSEEKGGKWQHETLHTSLMLQERNATEEKSEISINTGNGGLSGLPAHSEDNVENSQTRSSRKCAGSGTDFIATGGKECPQKDHTMISVNDREARGKTETDCHKRTDKMLSDSESQVLALIPAFHKLQVVEETHSGEQDIENLESGPRELPQGSQEVNITESRKVNDEMQKLAWDQTVLPGRSNKHKTNLDDLEKGENRSSVKHRLAAMSMANRKFPTKDLSPRRHVATIFPQSGSKSGLGHLSLGNLECDPLSPEPTPHSTGSTDESCLSNNGMNMEKSENPLQGMITSGRETSSHSCDQKSDSISQLHQNEFQNVSESPPNHEKSKDVTVAQILERESETPTQLIFTSLREVDFSDHQKRLSPPFPLEPAQKSTPNLSLASCQQQQRSASSLERESEPHLYRSKSLKNINVVGDQLRVSGLPKVRERHFSESTSTDNALSQRTLGNEFSTNTGYGRRFKSFSELPSCDENESWALYSSRTKTGPKSASSISRPIDYGIFGKEQQLAFLENVKRSLTQGRLWKPSFLKNPGFLKDDVINPSNTSESLSSNSPSSQVPKDGLFPNEPLNIYEEDPVDSDCDTDTTTDDEYYLDENDKESEL